MDVFTLKLKVAVEDSDIYNYYESLAQRDTTDSGIDLIAIDDIIISNPNEQNKIVLDFGIKCEPLFSGGYWLIPRSSIHKTKFRMANSIGLIDNGYRGNLMAQLDYYPNIQSDILTPHVIHKGTRLFQLVHPSTMPMRIVLADELGETERGTGGFGSTG